MAQIGGHISTERQVRLAFLGYLGVCLIWGTTYFAIKVGVKSVSPWLLAGVRFLVAGAVLIVAARLAGQRLPRGAEWTRLTIVALLLLCVSNGCVVWALQYVDSGVGALVIATLPIFTMGWLAVGGQRPTLMSVAGVLIGFAGLAIIFWPHSGVSATHPRYALGVAALLLAPVTWSLGSVYAQRRPVSVPPLMRVAVQSLVGGALMTVLGLIVAGRAGFAPAREAWIALAYLIVFGSIIGYGSYIYAIEHLSATLVSTYTYVNPVVALAIGSWYGGERLDARLLVGAVVMLVGVVLVNRTLASARTPPPRASIDSNGEAREPALVGPLRERC